MLNYLIRETMIVTWVERQNLGFARTNTLYNVSSPSISPSPSLPLDSVSCQLQSSVSYSLLVGTVWYNRLKPGTDHQLLEIYFWAFNSQSIVLKDISSVRKASCILWWRRLQSVPQTIWVEMDVSAFLHQLLVSVVCLFHEFSGVSTLYTVARSKDRESRDKIVALCIIVEPAKFCPTGTKLSFVVCLVRSKKALKRNQQNKQKLPINYSKT